MAECLLGVDLGTTSVKAGLFAANGSCLTNFSASYQTTRADGGRCEQNPQDWTQLIDDALAKFTAEGFAGEIGGGALISQVNTHVFLDRGGQPLLPAITWQDTRAAEEAAELDSLVSDADKIAWLGAPIPIDASHPLARMLWVSRHLPDIWEKTSNVLLPKDYALFHLTGELATDPLSNIGLVGLDGHYVPQILDLVPGAAERMAPIRRLTETMGRTRGGIPMATATMDGWVGLLGGGACQQGAFAYLSGTSEILGVASDKVTAEPGVVVFAETEGLRLHAGPTQSGGGSQQWFCDLTGISIAQIIDLVATSPRRAPTPLFLPQLAGERAPLWNADLRGAFLGLEAGMQTADFARALYEGVALSARHLLGALEASAGATSDILFCGGGGFKSEPWGQIRADVLGKCLQRLELNEPGLVGAACVAAVSIGQRATLQDAHAPFESFDQIWEPNGENRGFYDELFGIYKDAIDTNEAIGKRLLGLKSAN